MIRKAILAGGCFWCVENDLRKLEGVLDVLSGYTGGDTTNPTYENHKGHREAVQIEYDPSQTSYRKICQFFLDHIDPTDAGGQFGDRGESYKSAIYFGNNEEEEIARELLRELAESGLYNQQIAVDVLPNENFYIAEEYHQRYADKNPFHYNAYKIDSGRAGFQKKVCDVREDKKIKWRES